MLLFCADTKDSSMLVEIRLYGAISIAWYSCTTFSPYHVGVHHVVVVVRHSCVWSIYPMLILLIRPQWIPLVELVLLQDL